MNDFERDRRRYENMKGVFTRKYGHEPPDDVLVESLEAHVQEAIMRGEHVHKKPMRGRNRSEYCRVGICEQLSPYRHDDDI